MTAQILDLEVEKAARMAATHFHTIAESDRSIMIHIEGTFSPAAVRVLATAMLERAAAVEGRTR